jgi:multidrug resistance efflux pump
MTADVALEDIVGAVPGWISRAASAHLLFLVLGLGALFWFVKYPEVVRAPIAITAEIPPAPVYSRQAGQLKFWIKENADVNAGQILGEITGSADAASVIALRDAIRTGNATGHSDWGNLGELQADYSSLMEAVQQLRAYNAGDVSGLSRAADAHRLDVLLRVRDETKKKNELSAEVLELAQQAYRRDQLLYDQKLLPLKDLEPRKQRVIELEGEKKAADLALMNMDGEIASLRAGLEKSSRVEQIDREGLENRVARELATLESRIAQWTETHLLLSPVRGRVVFHKYWSDYQHVGAEQEVLVVWPASNRIVGKALADVSAAGRMRPGQRVLIRVAEYPFQEFGTLEGRVASLAKNEQDEKYVVTVSFPRGLVTSRGRKLTRGQGMAGSAEIITEDVRLFQRVFYQFRGLF